MAKRVSFKRKSVAGPPKGQPWVWHSAELRASPAWRGRSMKCVRLLERLELEHMANAGLENGRLIVSYLQFVEFGIGRRLIAPAIAEAEQRGLIEVVHRGTRLKDVPNRYRLTYYATGKKTQTGAVEWSAPTNEWRLFGERFQNCSSPSDASRFTFQQSENIPDGKHSPEPAETKDPSNVFRDAFQRSKSGLPIISSAPSAAHAISSRSENNPEKTNRAPALAELRAAAAEWIDRTGRGEQQRIVEQLGVTRGALSNFLAGRRSIGTMAEKALRDYLARAAAAASVTAVTE